jgi:hypothetical protein
VTFVSKSPAARLSVARLVGRSAEWMFLPAPASKVDDPQETGEDMSNPRFLGL